MLLSFKGKQEIKEKHLVATCDWLNMKNIPRSPEEITKELFNPIRTFNTSDCILEKFEEFPNQLGLPDWLGNLLFTINHHNSNDFSGFGENYEEYFYPAFLKLCNVGVDYSLMFHKWELMILSEMLPKQERDKRYFIELVKLHENALVEKKSEINKWKKLQTEIDNLLNEVDEFTDVPNEVGLKEIYLFENLKTSGASYEEAYAWRRFRKSYSQLIRDSGRVAFLSIENYVNREDPWTTSSEALVDALVEENINKSKNHDLQSEKEFRRKVWLELMERLLIMLNEWK